MGPDMKKIKAHKVICEFCQVRSMVPADAEICPKCCQYGFLEWDEGAVEEIFEVEEDSVEVAKEEEGLMKKS